MKRDLVIHRNADGRTVACFNRMITGGKAERVTYLVTPYEATIAEQSIGDECAEESFCFNIS